MITTQELGAPGVRVTGLRTRLRRLPLVRPWGATVDENFVIEVEITDNTGLVGTGLSWTPTIGPHAVQALLEHDLRAALIGGPVDPTMVWPVLWRHLHEAGSGGLTTIALAGIDLALWDLAGRRTNRSVTDLLGRRRDQVRVYGSGVNLHYPLDDLVAQARRWVAAGLSAVKIKVGKPDVAEDRDRVAAVREVIGPDRGLMIDANQRWDLDQATSAMAVLEEFGPAWIEEPLLADDLTGHAELRGRIATPVAMGENLHTFYRFRDALDLDACDILQPNVVRVGGVTPFVRIAELAASRGVELHPHLLPDLSGQLALALPQECLVEDVEEADLGALGVLDGSAPVIIADGVLTVTERPGLGLTFRAEAESAGAAAELEEVGAR